MAILNNVASTVKGIFSCFNPAEEKKKADVVASAYYVDTMAPAGTDTYQFDMTIHTDTKKPNIIEEQVRAISDDVDAILKSQNIDFEKLQAMVYKIVALYMRQSSKVNKEHIAELKIQVRVHAVKIQQTYNSWKGKTITIISAVAGVAAGAAGLSNIPRLASQSMALSSASTSFGGLSSIFQQPLEGERTVLQTEQQMLNQKKDDKKESSQGDAQRTKAAQDARKEHDETLHRVVSAVLNAG